MSAFKFIQTLRLTLMNATAFSTICRAHRAFRIAASLSLQLSQGLLLMLRGPSLQAPLCPLKEEAKKQLEEKKKELSAKDVGREISRLISPCCV